MPKCILYLGLDPFYYSQKAEGEITHFPIIEIIPRTLSEPLVHRALCDFEKYSHVIVTSKTTLMILKEYLPRIGIQLSSWANKSTIAVGIVTAKYLHHAGIPSTRIAQEETAEGVITELKQMDLGNAHVFWPHSSQARLLIKDYLDASQVKNTNCILYDPQPCTTENIPDLNGFDEIVFTSPSTVQAFLKIFGSFPSGIRLVPIGRVTARFLSHLMQNR